MTNSEVPGFQAFVIPLMQALADGQEHSLAELCERTAKALQLTDEARQQLIPSGAHTRVYDRVTWTRGVLEKAGLLTTVRRGTVQITPAGQEALTKQPERLGALSSGGASAVSVDPSVDPFADQTPEDALDIAYRRFRSELAAEVRRQIIGMTPAFFERLVVDLMLKLGYGGPFGGGQHLGQAGDGGVDGVISEDRLGLDAIYLQAKRYTSEVVGRPAVQAFVGSLEGQRAKKGVLLTTSTFSADARAYVKAIDKQVVLVDGEELAQLMIDTGLGVIAEKNYVVSRLDPEYFSEG